MPLFDALYILYLSSHFVTFPFWTQKTSPAIAILYRQTGKEYGYSIVMLLGHNRHDTPLDNLERVGARFGTP